MPTDLIEDLKGFFKTAPPPRRQLFSQWHEYEEPEPEPEPVVVEQPIIPVVQETPKIAYVPVTNQNARRKYNDEERNLRRMAVLRCMEQGLVDRYKIGEMLNLPPGTVWHDILYWRAQKK